MHLIAAVVEQDCAFGKGSLDLVCRDVGDLRASSRHRKAYAECGDDRDDCNNE